MRIQEVLIIVKRGDTPRAARAKGSAGKGSPIESISGDNSHHEETLRTVNACLKERGIRHSVILKTDAFRQKRSADDFDLVITIGGDGTLLRGSHLVSRAPLLGVNSNPMRSVGMLCGATASTFPTVLDKILKGRLKPTVVQRIEATIAGRPICPPALNDILFAHRTPASTTRYTIIFRGRREEHKSSGVWIATAAGSTAVALSAGGRVLPIGSKKLQFIVREPSFFTPTRMRLGMIAPDEKLMIRSVTFAGALYVDGQPTEYAVPFGAEIVFSLSRHPLLLIGYNRHGRADIAGKIR